VRREAVQRAVEAAGYTAQWLEDRAATGDREMLARERDIRRLGSKTLVGTLLSAPLMLGSFPDWFPWVPRLLTEPGVLFLPATPVHVWVGWQFHAGFWKALRHRTADMNTLVSVGTSPGGHGRTRVRAPAGGGHRQAGRRRRARPPRAEAFGAIPG